MPPKGSGRKKAFAEVSSAIHHPTLAEQLSFLHSPRPFKNLSYTKNANRRTKNLKTVLTQERERERAERERRRQEKEEQERAADDAMEVDTSNNVENEKSDGKGGSPSKLAEAEHPDEDVPTYTSIEAPPSLLPPRHYCDITGLEAPYTDPKTGLRYHDKSVYELIKGLSPSAAKDYLAARGVNPIVK